MTPPYVAYVMSRFPHLTETFILREFVELERQGWRVAVYPLVLQRQPVVHPDAAAWLDRVERLPWLSLATIGANLRWGLHHPGRYLSTMWTALRENASSLKFLVRTALLLPKVALAARRMQRAGVQHVHAHYATHPAMAAWVIHRLTGIPYSITAHAHDIYVERAMLATKVRDAAFVVAISEYNRQYLADVLGDWTKPRVQVIRCGVRGAASRARASSRAEGDRIELLTIGSLQPQKGYHVLLAAAQGLRARGVRFRWRAIGDGVLREELERQRDALGLQGVVEFLGGRTEADVERILATGHVYAQPSVPLPSGKAEGLPVAIMEAMAAGVPTVATRLTGIPELVIDGDTGWLVPPGDAAALADAIEAMIADEAEAGRRAARGRALVCREYDLETNVTRLGTLLAGTATGMPHA